MSYQKDPGYLFPYKLKHRNSTPKGSHDFPSF